MMKVNDNIKKYRNMTPSDLEKELGDLKSELFKLRFQSAITSRTSENRENPMSGKIKMTKKNIARVKTILREKELSEAE